MKRIAFLVGARPNYMKVFPVWRELCRRGPALQPVLIHTGQHYDDLLSDIFFREFQIPTPDYFLSVGSGPHGAQTGRVMIALEAVLELHRPDLLVVVGDVNSTLAGALVAVKMGLPVAHIEAGLRSGDRSMPEEINRLATDAVSDLLLTSCRDADLNLQREGVAATKIHFVGNVMIDSLVQLLPKAGQAAILGSLRLQPDTFCLVTLHRPSNVDHPDRLHLILEQLTDLTQDLTVVFPAHPRTRQMMERSGFRAPPGLLLLEPLGYLDFLGLESRASIVVTDSGGVQEETSFLGIPCLTVRPNTERPITITAGTNRLVDPERTTLRSAVRAALSNSNMRNRPPLEYWDGHAAGRIMDVLVQYLSA